ncbi:hypothetical protein ACVIW0_001448 [Bradyrhizobium sp. USDA 4454]
MGEIASTIEIATARLVGGLQARLVLVDSPSKAA